MQFMMGDVRSFGSGCDIVSTNDIASLHSPGLIIGIGNDEQC